MAKPRGGLSKWFNENWVDISKKDKDGKHPPCGRGESKKRAYPKCVPASKAARMSAKEKKSATRRKREKGLPKGGKPKNVSTKPKR